MAEGAARPAAGICVFVGATGARGCRTSRVTGGRISGGVALAGAGDFDRRAGAAAAHEVDTTKVKASGVDIVVAFDLSGSMASEDFEVRGQRVNRLDMARAVLKGFIDKRPNDRIGLVAFATRGLHRLAADAGS